MMPRRISSHLLAFIPLVSSAEIIVGGDNIFLDHSLVQGNGQTGTRTLPVPDPAGDDLILFTNGDLMHGTFGGIDEGLLWERKDINRPIKFGVPSVKQIIFNSARSVKMEKKSSFVTLVNGDRIPGEVFSLDDKNLTLKSSVVGDLTIPRSHVRTLTPNPFGGELHYIGPYTSDGWVIVDDKPEEEARTPENKAEKEGNKKEKKNSSWIHSGDSFYSLGSKPLVLADAHLPDVGRVRFHATWKGRFSLYVALHADLERVLPTIIEDESEKEAIGGQPNEEQNDVAKEAREEEEVEAEPEPLRRESLLDLRKGNSFQSIPWIIAGKTSHADLFGSCYTVLINSSYTRLMRNYFSETGVTKQTALTSSRGNATLPENGQAEIEIRFDRNKSLVMLFIDGKYVSQWNDLAGYFAEGSALGFYNSSSLNRVRISDLVVSSWSGVADSAASLANDERDIVLLTNDTDRISGEVSHIVDGLAHIKTEYTETRLPLSKLAQISFKGSTLTDPDAPGVDAPGVDAPGVDAPGVDKKIEDEDLMTIVYHPYGRIKMVPLSATATTLTGRSPFLGNITTDLEPAILLRFSDDLPDLSDWFDDF
jgi:hypothetical protein